MIKGFQNHMTSVARTRSPEPVVDAYPHLASTGGRILRLVEASKLTIRDAAKAAGISESMMRQEIQDGKIPVIRIGVKALILEQDLESYLRGHYVVEGHRESSSVGSQELPSWVEKSPLLQQKRKAS